MHPLSPEQIRSVFRTFLGGDPADPDFGRNQDGYALIMHIAESREHERFLIRRHEARQRYCVTNTPAGAFLTYGADKVIGEKLRQAGRFEEDAIERAIAFAKASGSPVRKSVFIDVGANIGTHSLHALSLGFERTICVEANRDNFRALRVNQILNDVDHRCTNIHAAASAENGHVTMETSPDNFGDHRVRHGSSIAGVHGEASWRTHTVPARRLDDILADIGITAGEVGLVWIDTQGHEGQVLAGASNLLASKAPIALEFWPYGLARSGGFDLLRRGLRHRDRIYDLRRPVADGSLLPVTLDMLDAMFDAMRGHETPQSSPHTDLLVL